MLVSFLLRTTLKPNALPADPTIKTNSGNMYATKKYKTSLKFIFYFIFLFFQRDFLLFIFIWSLKNIWFFSCLLLLLIIFFEFYHKSQEFYTVENIIIKNNDLSIYTLKYIDFKTQHTFSNQIKFPVRSQRHSYKKKTQCIIWLILSEKI